MCPAVLVGALAVLLFPAWMVTYWELDALTSVGLFHNDPTDPHSASSQIDCAWAAAVNRTRTSAGRILRWKKETEVLIASPHSLDSACIRSLLTCLSLLSLCPSDRAPIIRAV